jgi:hypothetical protein
MIDDLDQVLRQLLIRELPIKNHEVDIKFDLPKREWSSRVSRPTLNLFLHDLRENTTLREPAWEIERNGDGTVTKRRKALRVDLHYMITSWVADHPEDEHRLLARALMALFRNPHLPDDLLPESLQDQPVPIPIRVAQYDEFRTPADVWSALDNELRPAIACTVTLALNPYKAITGPLVRTRDLRFGQALDLPARQRVDEAAGEDRFWMVGGRLRSREPVDATRTELRLVDRGQTIAIREDGGFIVGNLEAGEYTLEVSIEDRKPSRHKITVPSSEYDIEL